MLHGLLELVIQHQDEGSTHASEHIGPGALEEGLGTLITGSLPPAVKCAAVHYVG